LLGIDTTKTSKLYAFLKLLSACGEQIKILSKEAFHNRNSPKTTGIWASTL
jgi:hypothetical protein